MMVIFLPGKRCFLVSFSRKTRCALCRSELAPSCFHEIVTISEPFIQLIDGSCLLVLARWWPRHCPFHGA